MAWRQEGDKPISEPIMVGLTTHMRQSASMSQTVVKSLVYGTSQRDSMCNIHDNAIKWYFYSKSSRTLKISKLITFVDTAQDPYSYVTYHYNDVIMSTIASQITSPAIVYSTVYSTHQRKHQSSAPLAFVRGIHRWPVNSQHKGPVTRQRFPFDDVIMQSDWLSYYNNF